MYCAQLTWRHVECTTTSKVTRVSFRRRQAEICQIDVLAVATTQYILWLQIPMKDTHVVAVLNSAHDLRKDSLDQIIVANILDGLRVSFLRSKKAT